MNRTASLLDCDAVYRLICGLEQKQLPYDMFCRIYQEQMRDGRYVCLVYEQENQVLGVLHLRFEWQLHHGARVAEILEFAVDPAHRGHGIGREMLEYACRTAKEAGCVQIEAACNQLRTDTHRFYEREGMHNYHFRFSKPLQGTDLPENAIGK